MRKVFASAPTRIDFGGGWTDVPPYSDREGGVVCNMTITRRATVVLKSSETAEGDPGDGEERLARAALARASLVGVAAAINSDFPRGAGLGGSSAAGVAMAGAIRLWRSLPVADAAGIAEESRVVEVEDLGVAGGRQDHYAAAFGGALLLGFGGATSVRRIDLSQVVVDELNERCLVLYTGQSRISGTTIRGVLDGYVAGERRIVTALAAMKALASQMAQALERGDVDSLGAMVGEHWIHQRSLNSGIPTPLIDRIIDTAMRNGALGGKALGASGGGCVLLVAARDRGAMLIESVRDLATRLPCSYDESGLDVKES
ncbi:MAG: GHMP family kinase ATP-binding protein [Gemmatimonadota bacterium]